MKSYIVIGLGRFGSALAKELFRLGHEVVVIDKDQDAVTKISDSVTYALTADAKDESVLKSVGVRNFDCAIVAFSNSPQDSIFIALMLKEIGAKYVIAKGRDELHIKVLNKIGVDKVVFPENDIGERLAQLLTSSNLVDYIEITDEYSIIEITAPARWEGQSIRSLDVRAKYGLNILVIKRADGRAINVAPSPEYIISRGDILVVIGSNEDIKRL